MKETRPKKSISSRDWKKTRNFSLPLGCLRFCSDLHCVGIRVHPDSGHNESNLDLRLSIAGRQTVDIQSPTRGEKESRPTRNGRKGKASGEKCKRPNIAWRCCKARAPFAFRRAPPPPRLCAVPRSLRR